jgi:hypothetical protein
VRDEATTSRPLTEKEWQAQVLELAGLLGWATYHPWLSIHSPRGWPDLALVRPPRLLLVELKSEKGKVTPAQQHWLELLGACPGVEAHVWRPSDWDAVTEILKQHN